MRRNGDVPGILYGPRRQATPVAFRAKEFREQVGGHESAPLIQLDSEADELRGRIALLKDAQYDALSGVITHADFFEVDMAEKIRVPVALHFVGKHAGAVHGGMLQPVCRELEVECLPASIPDFIEVDVTALEIHGSIHVSELVLPDGVTVPSDADFTLVTVAAPATGDTGGGPAGGEAAAGKS
jgi:large subunit ribosomal protein L25